MMNKDSLIKEYGSIRAACRALGIARTTLRERLENPVTHPIFQNFEKEQIKRGLAASKKPGKPSKSGCRVLAIGDLHVSRQTGTDRLEWLGKMANDLRPDYIVQIGDWGTFDSVSGHEAPGTIGYAKRPSFLNDDMPAVCESLDRFEAELNYNPIKHVCMGNHEFRLLRYENQNPESHGMFYNRMEVALKDRGWAHSPYGAYHFIEKVCFTHIPFNTVSKPISDAQIKQTQDCDLVFGHTHKKAEHRYVKANSVVTVVNLGCALPDGYIEEYAKHSLTGWWYGAAMINIYGGNIESVQWNSMREIKEKYGK